jgi:hypothetical protein
VWIIHSLASMLDANTGKEGILKIIFNTWNTVFQHFKTHSDYLVKHKEHLNLINSLRR